MSLFVALAAVLLFLVSHLSVAWNGVAPSGRLLSRGSGGNLGRLLGRHLSFVSLGATGAHDDFHGDSCVNRNFLGWVRVSPQAS